MNEPLYRLTTTFGCDPELFFADPKGKIIGSERVLPESGQLVGLTNPYNNSLNPKAFVLDGVQAELNPRGSTCRVVLGCEIAAAFKALKAHLAQMTDVKACFNAVVTIDKAELDRLSAKSKVFGCAPSKNMYDTRASVKANAATYKKRSAGGHIHLGLTAPVFVERERLVPIMDTLIGNTCVMIDRDPGAIERRKNYGRAGEYRLPTHGLEYRVLSNFWLRSYPLYALVMGLARMSVAVLNTTLMPKSSFASGWDAESKLLKSVDLKKVQKAINTNNIELAKENYQAVKAFIAEHVPATGGHQQETALDASNLDVFDFFCKMVEKKGIEHWFPEDPMEHWCGLQSTLGSQGWESFMYSIRPKMEV